MQCVLCSVTGGLVEHAASLAGCAAAAAAAVAAAPTSRLRAGDGLPGEVMMPRALVSLQSLCFHYELYTRCLNLNSAVSTHIKGCMSELPCSYSWTFTHLEHVLQFTKINQ